MIDCAEVTRLASDYIERRLRLRQRWGMFLHLLMCPGCKHYVEQIRTTIAALQALPQPAGSSASETVLEEFRRQARERRP